MITSSILKALRQTLCIYKFTFLTKSHVRFTVGKHNSMSSCRHNFHAGNWKSRDTDLNFSSRDEFFLPRLSKFGILVVKDLLQAIPTTFLTTSPFTICYYSLKSSRVEVWRDTLPNEWVLIATCKQLVWSTRIGRIAPIWNPLPNCRVSREGKSGPKNFNVAHYEFWKKIKNKIHRK
jgi:hypothetical protein